jgi:8-oxo-dGTP pyrophosphatase MutT (NUDIX family)
MILTRPPLIEALQTTLLKDSLPGQRAHYKMAHAVRRVDVDPDPAEVKEAAVLITLFEKAPEDWHLIFIRRGTAHEKDKHGGQIAFPGGKKEPGDRDLMFTALREAEEETSLDLTTIDVLGPLTPIYITVSKFRVHPFVAYAYREPILTRQESEVEEILEFPLEAFRNPASLTETRIHLTTGIILNHVPAFLIRERVIWGATAMIMSELLEVLDRERR